MLCNCTPDVVRNVLKDLSISSQIANMLSSQDLKIVVSAVQLVTILLEKVPELFGVYFRREGISYRCVSCFNSFEWLAFFLRSFSPT